MLFMSSLIRVSAANQSTWRSSLLMWWTSHWWTCLVSQRSVAQPCFFFFWHNINTFGSCSLTISKWLLACCVFMCRFLSVISPKTLRYKSVSWSCSTLAILTALYWLLLLRTQTWPRLRRSKWLVRSTLMVSPLVKRFFEDHCISHWLLCRTVWNLRIVF